MCRPSAFLILFFFCNLNLGAQQEPLLFPSIDQQEPTYYGDGVLNLLVQGDNLLQQSRFIESLQVFSSAIAQAPGLAEAYIRRAKVYRLTGDLRQAEEDYRRALRLDPLVVDIFAYGSPTRRANVIAIGLDSNLLLASDGLFLESYRQYLNRMTLPVASTLTAPSAFSEAEKESPWQPVKLEEALSQALAGNDAAGLRLIEDWPEEDAEAGMAYSLAGFLANRLATPEAAEAWLDKARAADPELSLSYYLKSRLAYSRGAPEEAHAYLLEALDRDQALVPARQDRLLLERKILAQSSPEKWTNEIGVYPSPAAYLNRSLAYFQQGDYAPALADAEQAIRLADRPIGDYFAWRGSLFLLSDQPILAENDFSYAIKLEGPDPVVLQNRGLARILAKQRGAGCADLKESSRRGNEAALELWTSMCSL
jgi:tetratricopeptide (TPR) repeat protein